MEQSFISLNLSVKKVFFKFFNSPEVISNVVSMVFFRSCTLLASISKPITPLFLPNSIAKGRPTYPRPIIAIFFIFHHEIFL